MPPSSTLIAGRYRLGGELGRGGMGIVWAAHDELLQRDVAVKEVHFPPSLAGEDRERLSGRTLREARAVAAVDTPSAVRVFDIVEQDGRPWIVMELLRGRTLSEALAQDGPLPQADVARVGLALVDALEAAHAAGILHRDVKPGNVLLVEGGRVALTDFGIATTSDDSSGDTTSGVVLGSPSYVAPERLQGLTQGAASDFWAMGATLWTAVEGQPPYAGANAYAVIRAVSAEDPPLATRCGPALRDLLRAVMDRDPARRPGPQIIRQALAEVLQQPDTTPTAVLHQPLLEDFDRTTVLGAPAAERAAPPRPVPLQRPAVAARPPRRRLPAVLAAAVVVLLLGIGALALRSQGSGGTSTAADPKPTPSRSSRPSSSPSARPEATTGAVAASEQGGYTDPSLGWSISVPSGWTRKTVSAGTRFSDPSSGRYVLVATRYPAGPSAVGAWEDSERSFRSSHTGYQRVRLETIDGNQAHEANDAADWEFRYTEGGASLHALDRAMVFGKRGYAVYVQAHDDDWDAAQGVFQQVEDSFRPGS